MSQQTDETTKIAKADKTAKIAKTATLDKTATKAKVTKTAKIAKVDKVAKTAKTTTTDKVAKTIKTNKANFKPLSKGQRTHERRMKQAARQDGTVFHSLIVRRAPVKKAGE